MEIEIKPAKIKRNFQDIPDDRMTEHEQAAFLMDLGWHNGSDWDELLNSKRVLIISEAGAGKTYECRTQQQLLWEEGKPAFYVELSDLARNNLQDLLSFQEERRFCAWIASESDIATFFLDSIDELKLTLGSFEQALKRLAKAVSGQLQRVRVVITSRPVPLDARLFQQILPVPDEPVIAATSEEFAKVAMSRQPRNSPEQQVVKNWRNVALLPLSVAQIKQMALVEGVSDPDALLADIQQRNAEEFVRRPQDLIEICADWRECRRIRSHLDQVASNINVKLKPRSDRREKAELPAEKAWVGACRLALAAILSRKLTLRHSVEADRSGDSSNAPLDPSVILYDWTQEERSTLLERPLFGFASYGRVRFHHRSVIEYLAAEHLLELCKKSMPIRAIKRILFTTMAHGGEVLKPSLRSVAAWMASRESAIFEEILRLEPDALLNFGDPESLLPVQRQRALRAYVERHKSGGWRGLRLPTIQLNRFASFDLSTEVKHLIEGEIENSEIREILLTLIGIGKMTPCADIAYGVAINNVASDGERIAALDALIHLDDDRLEGISNSIANEAARWKSSITTTAILRLFPTYLSVENLCNILARVTERNILIGDVSWSLARLLEQVDLTSEGFDLLRHQLTDLVLEGLAWDNKKWPPLASKRKFLLPALSATCLRQLQNGSTDFQVMRSTAVVLRLSEKDYDHRTSVNRLSEMLSGLSSDARRVLFEAEDEFLQDYNPQIEPINRYARLVSNGARRLSTIDADWVLASLADSDRSPNVRALLLEAAIRIRDDSIEWTNYLVSLEPYVSDQPRLIERLHQLAQPQKRSSEELRLEREYAKRQEHDKRREAKSHASWVMFWREIANDFEGVFSEDRVENTLWNLWQVMENSSDLSGASGWNRRFIERHFGSLVVDRLRFAMMNFWRKNFATLRSERPDSQKNTYSLAWLLGLAGIAAESEDSHWAEKLSQEESELALRYVFMERSGFPAWLEKFSIIHSASFDAILGEELSAELDESPTCYSIMLQNINYGTASVARLFLPRLCAWIDAGNWRLSHVDVISRDNRLRQVLQILIKHADDITIAHIRDLAKSELKKDEIGVLSSVWLPILMRLDPSEGIDVLDRGLQLHLLAKQGPAVNLFGSLFGDRHSDNELLLSAPAFTPDLLLRLIRLAYQHIRRCDDMERESGTYIPTARDHAETGRSNVLTALLSCTGVDGWAIKVELANDPLFVHFKDRALSMALELAAQEADEIAFLEADIVALDQYNELPPQTRDEIFWVMNDRLDDINDALLRDDSPRAALALIDDEKIMRQMLARELRLSANHAYTVDQEAVTADEKETDIRLRSTGSVHEAIIELKIGDKDRSASDLKATLKDQLVSKYMAAKNTRAGCLLITIKSSRTWVHPDTGDKLDFSGLIDMLNEEASRLEQQMGFSLRLMARGIDLRPRLPTEQKKLRNLKSRSSGNKVRK